MPDSLIPDLTRFWEKAAEYSSPAMFRGGSSMAIFIEATRWVPDHLLHHDYVIDGLEGGAAISALVLLYGVLFRR